MFMDKTYMWIAKPEEVKKEESGNRESLKETPTLYPRLRAKMYR